MKKFWNFLLTFMVSAYAVFVGSMAFDAVIGSNWYAKIKERRKNKRYSKVEEDED